MAALWIIFSCIALCVAEDMKQDPKLFHDVDLAPCYYTPTRKVENYILPIIRYDTALLQPFISKTTVEIHYYGHHEAYKRKMNAALAEWRIEEPDNEWAFAPIMTILENVHEIPPKYLMPIINNGGGYVNHAFYWALMTPNLEKDAEARIPTGAIKDDIEKEFGSYETFREEFTNRAATLFGSGYVWLVRNPKKDGALSIITTANQDCPISTGLVPLLVIDVWEHAYYLDFKNKRPDYIEKWWMLVDWENVQELSDFWDNDKQLPEKYNYKPFAHLNEEL